MIYQLSGDKITLPKDGNDCVNKALKDNGVDLKSITYDSGKDTSTISVHKIIDIKLELKHKSN